MINTMKEDNKYFQYAWEGAEELAPTVSTKQRSDKRLAAAQAQAMKKIIELSFDE